MVSSKDRRMAMVTSPPQPDWTLGDLLTLFGPLPLRRIRFLPAPGTATEEDVIEIRNQEKRLYELVDGVLVEKTVGYFESRLAMLLGHVLQTYLDQKDLGVLAGAGGMMRLARGLIRIPDLSFVSWDKFPDRRVPREPVPLLVPDLAVEILSESNTAREMERKLQDYFAAGVRLVWYVDPVQKTFRVFTGPDQSMLLDARQVLDGGSILPGLALSLTDFWTRAGQQETP